MSGSGDDDGREQPGAHESPSGRDLAADALAEELLQRPIRESQAFKRVLLLGLGASVVYGATARLTFGLPFAGSSRGDSPEVGAVFAVMTFAFLFCVPFAMGFAAVYLARIGGWLRAMLFPQIAALCALALALLFAVEGLICIVFWLPAYMLLTALGGLAAWFVLRMSASRKAFLGGVLLLPYGTAIGEAAVPTTLQRRVVETQIVIEAPPAAVWEEIVDVPLITEAEHGFAWSHLIGFPRPVSARSSSRTVGALREAKFEGGVVFYERVTRCEPELALEFDIAVDSRSIPAGTLDEHVTLGGPYFDVLTGSYRIEPRLEGGVTLHLSSEHRLSTHFNAYASWWTDFVMRDTQDYILQIVARRAERRADLNRAAGEEQP